MRVRFLGAFRWLVPERAGRVAVVFKPRPEAVLVRRCCGEAAVKAGVAEEVRHAGRKAQ